MMAKKKIVASGLTEDERKNLKKQVDDFVKRLIRSKKLLGEQIAIEVFRWENRGSNWGRDSCSFNFWRMAKLAVYSR